MDVTLQIDITASLLAGWLVRRLSFDKDRINIYNLIQNFNSRSHPQLEVILF